MYRLITILLDMADNDTSLIISDLNANNNWKSLVSFAVLKSLCNSQDLAQISLRSVSNLLHI